MLDVHSIYNSFTSLNVGHLLHVGHIGVGMEKVALMSVCWSTKPGPILRWILVYVPDLHDSVEGILRIPGRLCYFCRVIEHSI